MSMFANEMVVVSHDENTAMSVETLAPKCPLCSDVINPGTSEACQTPTGLWIIHKDCITKYNARNTPGAEWYVSNDGAL